MITVGVGGTFNVLHKGHRTLLDTAFASGDEVHIGLMSDSYTGEHKSHHVPLQERRAAVESYANGKGIPYTVTVIDHPTHVAATDPDLDVLVVSAETAGRADSINDDRRSVGLRPLRIVSIPYVLAQDYRPISSSRIISGEIDEEGRLLRPLRVCRRHGQSGQGGGGAHRPQQDVRTGHHRFHRGRFRGGPGAFRG